MNGWVTKVSRKMNPYKISIFQWAQFFLKRLLQCEMSIDSGNSIIYISNQVTFPLSGFILSEGPPEVWIISTRWQLPSKVVFLRILFNPLIFRVLSPFLLVSSLLLSLEMRNVLNVRRHLWIWYDWFFPLMKFCRRTPNKILTAEHGGTKFIIYIRWICATIYICL